MLGGWGGNRGPGWK